ncbi:MAG: polysaccharide biosynthesis/export family protein [Parvularcula sp.]
MKLSALLSFFVVLWLAVGCATDGVPVEPETATAFSAPDEYSADAYTLGSGDRIRLTVFGEEELSGEFAVDGSGHVSLPLIGEVLVRDMTVREFQKAVETALLDGFLKDPRVSAEVISHRPFYILGEVKRPGTYPYQSGLTVLNAVATAEGFTYRANERFVFIRREGETDEKKYPLTSSTPVRPGDTIRVAERFF